MQAWNTVNIPSPKGAGFSCKLCGNPLAWRMKAGSRPEICPHEHDLRSGNVAVQDASAFASVHPFGERLSLDRAAFRACLRSPARINQRHDTTGACSLMGRPYGAPSVCTAAKIVRVAPSEIVTCTAKPLAAPGVPVPLAFQETDVGDHMTAPMFMSPVAHETDALVMIAPSGTNPDISSW
jgi:hypothetical protein